jgi:hypothetical protein
MSLDIRIPIGLMFSLLGLILLTYGLITFNNPTMYERSLGININIWTGIALAIFGGIMLGMAWWAKKKKGKD